jgi:hypothetical protein
VVLRERVNMLTPVRDMLALFTAVTNPKDEPEDECLW